MSRSRKSKHGRPLRCGDRHCWICGDQRELHEAKAAAEQLRQWEVDLGDPCPSGCCALPEEENLDYLSERIMGLCDCDEDSECAMHAVLSGPSPLRASLLEIVSRA